MKRAIPIPITATELVSTTVPITETAWSSVGPYPKGTQVYQGLFVYEAARAVLANVAPVTHAGGVSINTDWLAAGNTPVADPDWLIVGMVNRWRMFDSYTSTVTTSTDPVVVVIECPYVDTIGFVGSTADTVTVEILDDADSVVSTQTVDLDQDTASDEWEWCTFPAPTPRSEYEVTLPFVTQTNEKIKVTISGSGSPFNIGKISIGVAVSIGTTQWDYTDYIKDYSRDEEDDFGETYLKQGRWVPVVQAVAEMTLEEKDAIKAALIEARAQNCMWNFNEGNLTLATSIIYGRCKEFRFTTKTRTERILDSRIRCTLTIVGAI
ncbi:MAG: hypothetical protein HGB35_01955 [Geobacteraceae bacterium]|nr:hypothetical protein [Geobacteraceae bacterium]